MLGVSGFTVGQTNEIFVTVGIILPGANQLLLGMLHSVGSFSMNASLNFITLSYIIDECVFIISLFGDMVLSIKRS